MSEAGGAQQAILLVEDDPAHSEAMARVLAAHGGYRLRFATTLADAQRSIESEPPDLVLADLNLADGSRVRTTRQSCRCWC
jgi:DNA-binding response OmpR family regulator